jgi:hypothetical protein
VTHGHSRKSNAIVKVSQLTSHGNVLMKEKNAFVKEVGSFMVLRQEKTRKKWISLEPSNFQWLSPVLREGKV